METKSEIKLKNIENDIYHMCCYWQMRFSYYCFINSGIFDHDVYVIHMDDNKSEIKHGNKIENNIFHITY
jgi:hypothetical protein